MSLDNAGTREYVETAVGVPTHGSQFCARMCNACDAEDFAELAGIYSKNPHMPHMSQHTRGGSAQIQYLALQGRPPMRMGFSIGSLKKRQESEQPSLC